MLSADELTDHRGYGAVLAFWTNLRVPGALPLVVDAKAYWGWAVEYERVRMPIAIVAHAALDALIEFEQRSIDALIEFQRLHHREYHRLDAGDALIIAIDHFGLVMVEKLLSAPPLLTDYWTGALAHPGNEAARK